MKPPVICLFNLHGERANQIRLLAMRYTIRVRAVKTEEFGQTLAALCGIEPLAVPVPAVIPFDEELLLLANFTSELLNAFLLGFKQANIPSVSLKAILTETNMSWNAVTLYGQLAEERTAIEQARAAGQKPTPQA